MFSDELLEGIFHGLIVESLDDKQLVINILGFRVSTNAHEIQERFV